MDNTVTKLHHIEVMCRPKISAKPRKLIIDTDPGVDDALALILAYACPEIEVRLITTVAGNVPLKTANRNVKRLLGFVGLKRPPQVAYGADRPLAGTLTTATDIHGEDGLGGVADSHYQDQPLFPTARIKALSDAPQAIIDCINNNDGQITLVALGPLTNVARAIQRAPKTLHKLERLIIMGGAIHVSGNVTPSAEFNMFVDPEAAKIVLATDIKTTLIPLDVTQKVKLSNQMVSRYPNSRTKVAVNRLIRSINRRCCGIPMHDPLALATAIDSSLVSTKEMYVGIESSRKHTRGTTLGKTRAWTGAQTRISVALDVDPDRCLNFFTSRVLSKKTGKVC